ncbi:SGNH/GDSL hydrolase family protein [Streptomyces sp. AD681]|uniref:SGNH/GDSL hydrolase family protein n=1 Tax=Streptomyces sp. AD681 TaxID=3019069 RepID=UPI0022F170E3|nr:SGNH/GDSL hydrolase family protein [Streptomyces sp. AD681]MDA5145669.1 SGNH/GDSL hydrolase family protein [Streptomyces sp. AD681]
MTLVVLYGDSMLARFTKARIDRLEEQSGPDAMVLNCAAGGWTSEDGVRRAEAVAGLDPDVVVLSFGTNDCAPERLVELDAFAANVQRIVARFPRAKVVGFLPPSVLERAGVGPRGRTNSVLARYRTVLRDIVGHDHSVETDRVLAPLVASGTPVHVDDLHLTDEAYGPVITAVARAICRP